MPVEDMAGDMGATAVGMVGTASNMPRPVMLRADTAPFVLAVGVAANLSDLRAAVRVMQGADITKRAAIAGEAGEVTMDIRTMDIPAIV
jgi:hypothetical protein